MNFDVDIISKTVNAILGSHGNCGEYGKINHETGNPKRKRDPLMWRECSKCEKLAHLASIKLQSHARRMAGVKRANRLRRKPMDTLKKKQEDKTLEKECIITLSEMDKFLDQTYRERENKRMALYKDNERRYYKF